MIKKHIIIMTRLCGPHAFLLAQKRPNGRRNVVLVESWSRTKLTISEETLVKWVTLGYIMKSVHVAESYMVTDTGRRLVAQYEEPDRPFRMADAYAAQQLARAALGGGR